MEENTENTQVRGMPKSGKFWKTPKEKFRKIHRTIPKKSKEQHLKVRAELKRVKELSKSIKEERKQQNELKKQRREENLQRKKENELKSQTVQIIKNTAKLKRIKKKHLRQIQKRDLDTLKSKVV
jgi:rRNA-processing protein CGR1